MGCGSNSTLRHTALQEELARTQAELERSKAAAAQLARTPEAAADAAELASTQSELERNKETAAQLARMQEELQEFHQKELDQLKIVAMIEDFDQQRADS